MRRRTNKSEGGIRRATATGLVALLFLASFPGCTARHTPDWSRVQAITLDTKTEVHLYEDEGLQESRETTTGRFHSATADSLTLKFEDGGGRKLSADNRAQGIDSPSCMEALARMDRPGDRICGNGHRCQP